MTLTIKPALFTLFTIKPTFSIKFERLILGEDPNPSVWDLNINLGQKKWFKKY